MASKTDICNFALGLVAEERIGAITDATEPARLCLLHLDQTVREVLRRQNWRSCRKRAALVQSATAPAFGWDYAYPLPVDWVRTVAFNEIDPQMVTRDLFEIEGRSLLTDETTANILYIYDVTQSASAAGYGDLDPFLVKAIYTALAAKLAWPLQQSRTLQEKLESDVEAIIRTAATAGARDAFEPLVNEASESRWAQSRQI